MSEKKPSWNDIKPLLAERTSVQLRRLLQDLYGLGAENKEFFHARFLNNRATSDHLEPYKTRIYNALCPKDPLKQEVKLSAGREAINKFKKANDSLPNTLNLMLYYVECGNEFTLKFGDIDEKFYDSMTSMFGNIVKILIEQRDNVLASEFIPQLETEFKRVEWVGWGYGDALGELLADLKKVYPDFT